MLMHEKTCDPYNVFKRGSEPRQEISNKCGMCDQQRLRPACAYAQSDQILCKSLEYSMNVQLLAEQHLEFLSLKEGCTEWSESTIVKTPYCWKSHVTAHLFWFRFCDLKINIYNINNITNIAHRASSIETTQKY